MMLAQASNDGHFRFRIKKIARAARYRSSPHGDNRRNVAAQRRHRVVEEDKLAIIVKTGIKHSHHLLMDLSRWLIAIPSLWHICD